MKFWARTVFLTIPIAWVLLAHIGPLVGLARISFLETFPTMPGRPLAWSLDGYRAILDNASYRTSMLRTLALAATTTIVALLLAYPLAYHVARRVPGKQRGRRLLFLIAPFWTSEVLRMFALVLLLSNRGALNSLLRATGLTNTPFLLLYGEGAVLAGMAYTVLLTMLLPIYAALDRLPPDLLEVASDLGAGAWQRFRHVTLPLTMPGVASGCALTFLACLGVLAAPALLGGPATPVLATTIGNLFGASAGRWPAAAAFSLIVLAIGTACAGLIAGLPRSFTRAT